VQAQIAPSFFKWEIVARYTQPDRHIRGPTPLRRGFCARRFLGHGPDTAIKPAFVSLFHGVGRPLAIALLCHDEGAAAHAAAVWFLPANHPVASAKMSRSVCNWPCFASQPSEFLSYALVSDSLPGRGLPASIVTCATQFRMTCAEHGNSQASLVGPQRAPAQPSAGETQPDTEGVISAWWTPFISKDQVPTKPGQLHSRITFVCHFHPRVLSAFASGS
jgi:hypothetical protein